MRTAVDTMEKIQGNLDIILKDYDSFLQHREYVKLQFEELKEQMGMANSAPFPNSPAASTAFSFQTSQPYVKKPASCAAASRSSVELALSTPTAALPVEKQSLASSPEPAF